MLLRNFIISYAVISVLAAGQLFCQDNSIEIKGYALDSLENPLVGATVLLNQQEDGVMEDFALTDDKGYFQLVANRKPSYILQISYVGYGTFERIIELDENQTELDLGKISLNPLAIDLAEVTIKDAFIPIVIKEDTIEYNANAFKTRPNATVEDLLKKLPGVEVEKDGTIKAQGEEVQNVLVDGKEFFEDDPKIATRNIPADVVDKVQVFDKASDLAAFTGIEDGADEKTINLAIKEGKNKGWFGQIEGAGGTDNRYKGNTLVNRFNSKMQLSLLGNANNINDQVFTLEDYLKFSGGLEDLMENGTFDFSELPSNLFNQNGINKTATGGVNFNYDFSPKTTLRTNYFTNFSNNTTIANRQSVNFIEQNSFFLTGDQEDLSELSNHRAKVKLKHEFDKSQRLLLEARFNFNKNQSQSENAQRSFLAPNTTINEAEQFNRTSYDLLIWNTHLQYQKKLKKAGRYFTAQFEIEQLNSDGKTDIQNFLVTNSSSDSILQQQQSDQFQPTFQLEATYSEPIGKTNYLQFKAGYQQENNDKEKLFFDQFENSVRLNNQLSNVFDRSFGKTILGSNFKMVRSTFNWTMGVDYQMARQKGNATSTNNFDRNFYFFLPASFFNYSFSGTKKLRVRYRTNAIIPSIEQMQPVLNNANPLFIIQGNPDLRPEYQHQLDLNYTSFNQFFLRSIFAGFYARWTQHKIVNAATVNEDLSNSVTPVNSGVASLINGYFNYDFPIPKANFKVGLNTDVSFQSTPLFVNGLNDRIYQTQMGPSFQIQNKQKEILDWKLSYDLDWNLLRYQKEVGFNRGFLSHSYLMELTKDIKEHWFFTADIEHIQYNKDLLNASQSFTFIDLSVTRLLKDGQFSFYLKGRNLLNEINQFERFGYANQFQSAYFNRIGNIFLVGMVYKIRNFGA